jgi:hypothetical protein
VFNTSSWGDLASDIRSILGASDGKSDAAKGATIGSTGSDVRSGTLRRTSVGTSVGTSKEASTATAKTGASSTADASALLSVHSDAVAAAMDASYLTDSDTEAEEKRRLALVHPARSACALGSDGPHVGRFFSKIEADEPVDYAEVRSLSAGAAWAHAFLRMREGLAGECDGDSAEPAHVLLTIRHRRLDDVAPAAALDGRTRRPGCRGARRACVDCAVVLHRREKPECST